MEMDQIRQKRGEYNSINNTVIMARKTDGCRTEGEERGVEGANTHMG